jgi:hypothetical protein
MALVAERLLTLCNRPFAVGLAKNRRAMLALAICAIGVVQP